MYLKVYGKQNRQEASVEEVQAALPSDMKGLTVDMDLGYPCVEFPQGAKYNPEYLKVQRALQDAGFETE